MDAMPAQLVTERNSAHRPRALDVMIGAAVACRA
jgi:hypothetical protein